MTMNDGLLDAPDPCDRCTCVRRAGPRVNCDRASQAAQRVVTCKTARTKFAKGDTCKYFEPGGGDIIRLFDCALRGEPLPEPKPKATGPGREQFPSTAPIATVKLTDFMVRHLAHGGAIETVILTPAGPGVILLIGPQK